MHPSTFLLFLTGAVLLAATAAVIYGYRFRLPPDPRQADDGAETDVTGELNERLFTPPRLTESIGSATEFQSAQTGGTALTSARRRRRPANASVAIRDDRRSR